MMVHHSGSESPDATDTPIPTPPPEDFGTRLMLFPREQQFTMKVMQWIFDRSEDSIARAVARGELPPPVKMLGENTWLSGAVRDHIAQRQDAARLQAAREQAQKDTKVQVLRGGHPHGRRN